MNMQTSNLLGVLAPLFEDPAVTELIADGHEHVYVEREGQLVDVPTPFRDEAQLLEVILSLAGSLDSTVNEAHPMLDLRLPDFSRVNIVLPPISLSGPLLTIRKFIRTRLTLDDLLRYNCLTNAMLTFLRACIEGRCNIVISGGVSAGKITFLSLMAGLIPPQERIIVVEEVAQILLLQPRVVMLESRPPDINGKGEITVRDLIHNALRMRPDRLILDEAHGGEVLALVDAMINGHDGTLLSLHASSPFDALFRLENMAALADPSIPLMVLRTKIATAVDLIVQIERLADGSRKVMNISEVTGFQEGVIKLKDIFEYRQADGVHTPTGHIPTFLPALQAAGFDLPVNLFTPTS